MQWLLLPALMFMAAPSNEERPARIVLQTQTTFQVELDEASPLGPASIREHAIAWHPGKRKFYLVADVVPLDSPHHPNTYDTELHLWSSPDLAEWTYHGVAVPKGTPGRTYDGYGAATPAGMAYLDGRLYVPFSARKTSQFTQRGIGLAWSGANPEELPWSKTPQPISDIMNSEDDDPAVLVMPGDPRLHLYHRRTGRGGYRIAYTASPTPEDPASWPPARDVTARPSNVNAQELTGACYLDGTVQLLVIEHAPPRGLPIAHLAAAAPDEMFLPVAPNQRYLSTSEQPRHRAYGGHITPVLRDGALVACFWTVPQEGSRYGLEGHPASLEPRR